MTLKAHYHELMVYLASRPFQFVVGYLTQFFGSVLYLPFNATYFVNDPSVARAVLTDTEHFSLNAAGGLGALISEVMGKHNPALFNMEGHGHIKTKTLLLEIFRGKYLEKVVKEALQPEVELLKHQFKTKGEVDVAAFSRRCTARLSCHMVGITAAEPRFEELLTHVTELSDGLTSLLSITDAYPSPAAIAEGRRIYQKFGRLIKPYYQSTKLPKLSVMAKLREQGIPFSEAQSLMITLVIAGTETVASSLPRICALVIDDKKWQYFRAHPALLPPLVSEGLRLTSPAPVIVHGVKRDQVVAGITFKANRRILIMLLNILRSNRFFENAMTLDPQRNYPSGYRSFWFGAGPHYCLGAQMAQLELEFMMRSLFAVLPMPQIKHRSYTTGSSFPGYHSLRVHSS